MSSEEPERTLSESTDISCSSCNEEVICLLCDIQYSIFDCSYVWINNSKVICNICLTMLKNL